MNKTALSVKTIIELGPKLLRRYGQKSNGAVAISLRNLRPVPGLAGEYDDFVPVGAPVVNTAAAGWVPVADVGTDNSGRRLLLKKGQQVALSADVMADPTDHCCDAGAEALCALRSPGGDTIVMTTDGARRLNEGTDGAPTLAEAVVDYPAVVLRAVAGAPVQATVGARQLQHAYTSGQALTDSDNRALVSDYVNAYAAMTADAAAAGCYLQPVLARYRLLDSAGRVLFESAPKLLSHPDGQTCTGSQALYSTDGRNVESYTLTARSWALMVETAPCTDAAFTGVAAVEILSTPQFHPYNPRKSASAIIGRLGSTSTPWAHVSLPGRSDGLHTGFGDGARRRVMKAIARMEAMEQRMAYVPTPFRSAGLVVEPLCSPTADIAADAAALNAGLTSAVRSMAYERVLLGMPHSFSASKCCAGGATVAWAGLSVRRYRGYRSNAFAATTEAASEGHTLIAVRFKGMTGVMRQEEISSLAPATFGPVLCYPAPDATEMTISTTIGGVTRRRVFALEPDESGRYSVFVDSTLSNFQLPAVTVGGILSLREPVEKFPGAVAIAPAERPLNIHAYTIVTAGSVEALLSRNPAEASWEFGRERYLAACADRVVSVGVDTSSWRLSLRVLMPSGIPSPSAALAVNSDIYLLSGSELLSIGPRGAVKRLDCGLEAHSLAYDATHNELLAIGTDTYAHAYCAAHDWAYFRRSIPGITSTVQIGGTPYGLAASGLVILDCESTTGLVSVGYACAEADKRRPARRPGGVRLVAAGTNVDATFTFTSCGADAQPRARLAAFELNGPMVAPLSVRVAAAPVRVARLDFTGKVSADFRLNGAQLITD